ncbi:MAG: hypothetical protein QNJ74_09015 [Trichodesmium sp. MO_231.B1]|nr:hypothetical protein [Trichodesmium sp. MO_231.B1]
MEKNEASLYLADKKIVFFSLFASKLFLKLLKNNIKLKKLSMAQRFMEKN